MISVSKTWNSVAIAVSSDDGFYNGTSMCRSCGSKLIADYLRTQRSVTYRDALAKHLHLPFESLTRIGQSGSHDGTWIHPRVAIDLARWLCPEFAVHMDEWFIESMTKINNESSVPVQSREPVTGTRTFSRQMQLMNETDLHYRTVSYLRRFHPCAIFIAGLGELQDSEAKRLDAWAKGYLKGQPDLLILNPIKKHCGLAIEFKHPGAQILQASSNQVQALEKLKKIGFITLISNDYDIVCRAIDAHMVAEMFRCECCGGLFSSERAIEAHLLRKRLREINCDEQEEV